MKEVRYIASCSGGKDSVATILLAAHHNEPLEEIVYCKVQRQGFILGSQMMMREPESPCQSKTREEFLKSM